MDNQIVTLTTRSPGNSLSGCSIVRKNDPKSEPADEKNWSTTTETPIEFGTTIENESEIDGTETIFDKYLRRTTALPTSQRDGKSVDNKTGDIMNNELKESMEKLNDTEVFNETSGHGHNGGGLYFKHDIGLENELENTTEYKMDVEELFEPARKIERFDDDVVTNRQRRSNPLLLRPNRETYIVRCHNKGSFISSRERWWFIAVANCGNNKGLDIKYRFKMTNGQSGDFWHEHFSADERRE